MAAVTTTTKYIGTITEVKTTKNDDGSVKTEKENYSESTDNKAAFVAWLGTVSSSINS